MKEQLLKALENSKGYTLEIAEAMPEKAYGFKLAENVWNFGQLLQHIAYGIHWWEENYIKGNEIGWDPPTTQGTKKQVKKVLEQRYSALQETISHLPPDKIKINGLFATLDHITHHRGQAVTYLRCQGIVPPEYRF